MTQPRSILMFVPYYPPYMGGIANHAQEFAEAFADETGNAVTLAIPRFKDSPMPERAKAGVTLVEYPAMEPVAHVPLPRWWTQEYKAFKRQIEAGSYDVVFSRTRFFASSWMARRFARKKGLPWIHIEHGSSFVTVKNPLITGGAWLYDQTLGRSILASADEVISISKAVQNFVGRFRKKKTPCLTRGIQISNVEKMPEDHAFRSRYPDKIVLLWAGRMTRWKGVDVFLEGLKQLPKAMLTRIQVGLIGDGEDRALLEKLAEGLPVTFLGAQSREKVIGLLKSSDVYVHAARPGGGLSTSLLEAMLTRNAIVATPNEGADEVITSGEEGVLVLDSGPEGFARALEALLLGGKPLETYAQSAHDTVVRRFAWPEIIAQYKVIMDRIIQSKHG